MNTIMVYMHKMINKIKIYMSFVLCDSVHASEKLTPLHLPPDTLDNYNIRY